MEENTQHLLNPGHQDRIFSYTINLPVKGLIIVLLSFLGLGLLPVLISFFENNFFPNPNDKIVSVVEDFGNVSLYIVGLAALVLIANHYFGGFSKVLDKLGDNGVIQNLDKDTFVTEANSIFSRWTYARLPYLMSVLISIFVYISFSILRDDLWYSYRLKGSVTMASFAMIPVVAVTFYFLWAIALRLIAVYFVLKLLFQKSEIEIQPLHPDNCGGLSPLGKLSQSLNLGIFLWGGIVFLNIYQHVAGFYSDKVNYFIVVLILLGYMIGAYIAFFVPLNAVHKSMEKAKEAAILNINHGFSKLNESISRDIKNKKLVDKGEFKDLENLKILYDMTIKMPVYPYNFRIVASFVGSIFIPLLLSLISIFIEALLK